MINIKNTAAFLTACMLLLAGCTQTGRITAPPSTPTISQGTALSDPTPTLDSSISTLNPAANPQEEPVVITLDMNGKTFNLSVGETFEVQLATIPMAGSNWQPDRLDTAILTQIGDAVYTPDTRPDAAGGIVTLKFKAVGAGSTNLLLIFAQASKNGMPAMHSKTFGVTIVVK